MQQSDIPQCAIRNRNVYISILNGTLWDMRQVGALCDLWINFTDINLLHKSHNAPIRYPTMHHSEQKCAHFFSVHCRIWDKCIEGFVNLVYCFGPINMPRKLKQTRTKSIAVPDPQDTLWYVYLRNGSSNIHYHKIVSVRGGWHLKGIN